MPLSTTAAMLVSMDPLRCLIVDDSLPFQRSARALLERGGVTVVGVASTVDEALQQAVELEHDIVLLDVHIGDESGFELARRLEHEAGVSPARMILTSTFPVDDLPETLNSASVAGFIPKAELSALAIRQLLGRAS